MFSIIGTKIAMGMGLHPGICMVSALVYPDNTLEEYDEDSLSSGVDLGDSTLDMLNN